MGEPARLEERVTHLETEVVEVRYLATRADREAADIKAVLTGHTRVLNALREDQTALRGEVSTLRVEMNEKFAMVDAKFDLLREGQLHITQLLTRHTDECEKN